MKVSFSSTIAGAAILLTFFGVLSKGLGFLREILFAGYFGLSTEFDTYLVGAVLPVTLNTIILYLGQNFLIPAGNRIKEERPGSMYEFLNINFYIFILGGVLLAIILYFSSSWIINLYLPGTSSGAAETTKNIFQLYLLSIPVSAAISVLSAGHQLNFNFNYPAYSTILLNITFILLIIIFSKSLNIYVIPTGYLTGSFLQMIYLVTKTDISIRPKITGFINIRKYISSTLLMIILVESIGQLYILADRFFWNFLPEGGLAALNYAQTIFLLPVSILSIALSTAVFPKLTEAISRKQFNELDHTFSQSIKINILIFVPLTFLLIYYGEYFIAILFERGKFTGSDTKITYNALIFYSISLIFYSVYSVANKMLYGLRTIRQLLYITIAGISIKILLNFFLVEQMKQNGLALSTSISYIFFTFGSLYVISKNLYIREKRQYLNELVFHCLNGFLAFVLVNIISRLVSVTEFPVFAEVIFFGLFILLNLAVLKHSSLKLIYRILINLLSGEASSKTGLNKV